MKNAHQSIWLLLTPVVFVLLWSGGYAVAKVGIKYAEPITLLVWRYILVVVLLVPFYLALKPPLPKRRMDWVHMAVVGVLVQGVYFGMCWFAFSLGISAGVVAIIMSLQPILVAILAPTLANENVSWLRWTGLILGFIGVMVVIAARSRLEPPNSTTSPFARTALRPRTWFEVMPYLRQWAPPALNATLPPMVQTCWLEGSGA